MKLSNIFKDPSLRPIEVYGTILGLLLVTYSFYETNRLTWLNAINSTSLELSKMEIENDFATCLYRSEESIIVNKHEVNYDICKDKVYNNVLNIKKATLYLEENLSFFIDIIKYDKKYNEDEFVTYYREWYIDLHKDNNFTNSFQTTYIKEKINFIDKYIESKLKK